MKGEMSEDTEIKSEFRHILKILWSIITWPFVPFLIIFGKKKFSDLLGPIKEIWKFFSEAKFTAWLIGLNVVITITIFFLGVPPWAERIFILYPVNIFKIFSLEFLSLIGAGFMHGSAGHLAGNMLFLFILGRIVEKKIGPKKTAVVYFASLIISHLGSSILYLILGKGDIGSVGASGAISGLASAAMLLAPFSFTYLLFGIPIPMFIVAWLSLFSDISGVGSQIAGTTDIGHIAHLAGFFAVIPIMFLMHGEEKEKFIRGLLINIGLAVAAVIVWFFL